MDDALFRAREKLNSVTPLKRDCGRVCSSRCCDSLEGEETGMLLFPGEDAMYRDMEEWKILEAPAGPMVVCPGTCSREDRPLACRLFPLLPVIRDGAVKVAADQRARAVCPLLKQGIRGMDPAFTEAVRETGRMLAEVPEERAFLEKLTEEQDELKALREKLGGSHV